VYERFTGRGREVLVLAQEAARGLGHPQIEPEHLLLGLLAERESMAAWTLNSLGLDLVRVHNEVVRIEGAALEPSTGQIPFSYPAKRVVDFANAESPSGSVSPEHILLGLLDQLDSDAEDQVAGQVLAALQTSAAAIRAATSGSGDQSV
jgi:ATP-dependent Clp protease ATP-binding subunit ClpC